MPVLEAFSTVSFSISLPISSSFCLLSLLSLSSTFLYWFFFILSLYSTLRPFFLVISSFPLTSRRKALRSCSSLLAKASSIFAFSSTFSAGLSSVETSLTTSSDSFVAWMIPSSSSFSSFFLETSFILSSGKIRSSLCTLCPFSKKRSYL